MSQKILQDSDFLALHVMITLEIVRSLEWLCLLPIYLRRMR